MEAIRARVYGEVEAKKAREMLEETNRVLEKFHAGVAKLRDLYHSSLQEYAEETERTEKEELAAARASRRRTRGARRSSGACRV